MIIILFFFYGDMINISSFAYGFLNEGKSFLFLKGDHFSFLLVSSSVFASLRVNMDPRDSSQSWKSFGILH